MPASQINIDFPKDVKDLPTNPSLSSVKMKPKDAVRT